MKKTGKHLLLPPICVLLLTITFLGVSAVSPTIASDTYGLILLSDYVIDLNIGETYSISAITSDFKKPTWKSSDSKTASVSAYGIIKAKKAGTAVITARIKNAEACCVVNVRDTVLTLNKKSATLKNLESITLKAEISSKSEVKWKSSSKSIATVDQNGKVTAKKPGTVYITAGADGKTAKCKITVLKPRLTLDKKSLTLYRNETATLNLECDSKVKPVWKSGKKSVATVNEFGTVTAKKHGTAIISVTVDGVTRECVVTVKAPVITLSADSLELNKGETFRLEAEVSSGNSPVWTSSNSAIVRVDETGMLHALSPGKAYIYASEDGTKVRCTVSVNK